MILYRGQEYGAPLGVWWTTERADAEGYARSRGANRRWVVLRVEIDGRKLGQWRQSRDAVRQTFRIPLKHLRQRVLAADIVGGFLEIREEEVRTEMMTDELTCPNCDGEGTHRSADGGRTFYCRFCNNPFSAEGR